MKLLIVTRPDFFVGEGECIRQLFEAGLERLHLRKPGSERVDVERLLNAVPARFHRRMVLHDHFALASEYSTGGIHLNARNPVAPCGFAGSVSRSCHSLEEVAEWKPLCDYLFLSPVFDSISKNGYLSSFSSERLFNARNVGLIDGRVFALGGVEGSRFPRLAEWGFGGAVLLGDIWQRSQDDIVPHFERLLRLAETVAHSAPRQPIRNNEQKHETE